MESRRLIMAVVLSMAVIFVFGVLIPSFFKEKEPPPQAQKKGGKGEQKPEGAGQRPGAGTEGVMEEEKGAEPVEKGAPGGDVFPSYPEERVTLESALVKAEFSTTGASIVKLELLDRHYTKKDGLKHDVVSRSPVTGEPMPLLGFKVDSGKRSVPEDLPYRLEKKEKGILVFASEYGPWRIERRFRILGGYRINVSSIATNLSEEPQVASPVLMVREYKEPKKVSGIFGFLNPSRDIPSGLCNLAGDTERKNITKLQKDKLSLTGAIGFAAIDDLYFIAAMVPVKGGEKAKDGEPGLAADETPSYGCSASSDENGIIAGRLTKGGTKLTKGQSIEIKATTYIGPKEYIHLSDFGYELKTAIDFGWFGALAIFFLAVLKTFYSWVGNWGIAIILLTIVIKIILLPLTHWSYVSMRNMAAVKPLIDDINKRFGAPEDREKKNQAMLELYKTHKINPMMGCFPMLLQMPIWIALYSMLARSVELYQTPFFLWIQDLSQRDPYFILPIVLGASMFLQQKMTPTTADSQQAKMMLYFMPVMFTVFMLFLPAGLNLYILVSTLLTILQQKFMYKPRVATAADKQVQLMADIDQKELGAMRKDKKRK